MTPAERLTRALVDLAHRGERPRCGDPVTRDLWTSEDREERQLAASWCTGCPVLDECHAAAEATPEVFGVWAGIDRSPHKGPPSKYPAAAPHLTPQAVRYPPPARFLALTTNNAIDADESVVGGALSVNHPRRRPSASPT